MMNIKALTKFFLSNTAMLAGMLVPLTRLASLFVPVRTVVDGAVAAFEVRMVKPTHDGKLVRWWMILEPQILATAFAEFATAPFNLIPWGAKQFAALLTSAFDTAVVIVAFLAAKLAPSFCYFVRECQERIVTMFTGAFNLGVRRVIFAVNVFALPLAKAFLRTESLVGISVMGYGATALFAMHFWEFNNTKVLLRINGCGAFTATINAWPGSEIPERFATSRASGIYSTVSLLVFSTAKTGVFLVVLKNSMAILASGLHKKAPPVAMPNGLFA